MTLICIASKIQQLCAQLLNVLHCQTHNYMQHITTLLDITSYLIKGFIVLNLLTIAGDLPAEEWHQPAGHYSEVC